MMQVQADQSVAPDRRGISLFDRIIGAIDCSPWSAHTAASGRCRGRTDLGTASPGYSSRVLSGGSARAAVLSGAAE